MLPRKKGGKGGLFAASTQKFVVVAALGRGTEGQWTESKSERWGRQGSWLVVIVCVPPPPFSALACVMNAPGRQACVGCCFAGFAPLSLRSSFLARLCPHSAMPVAALSGAVCAVCTHGAGPGPKGRRRIGNEEKESTKQADGGGGRGL